MAAFAAAAGAVGSWCDIALCPSAARGREAGSRVFVPIRAVGRDGEGMRSGKAKVHAGRDVGCWRPIVTLYASSAASTVSGRRSCNLRCPAAEGGEVSSQPEEEPDSKVLFTVQKQVNFGEALSVTGSARELGEWDLGRAVPLAWFDNHVWKAEVAVPVGQTVEYKYVVCGKEGEVVWQPGENRVFRTDNSSDLIVPGQWEASQSTLDVSDEISVSEADAGTTIPPGADFVEAAFAAVPKVAEIASDPIPDISDGNSVPEAAVSGNTIPPGADFVEASVSAIPMLKEMANDLSSSVSGKSSDTDDGNSGKGGSEKENTATEVPVAGAILASAVTNAGEQDEEDNSSTPENSQ